jgi:hypothetical protein
VTKWPNLGQLRPKLAKIGPKEPNAIDAPIAILETALLAQGIGLIGMTTLRVYLK